MILAHHAMTYGDDANASRDRQRGAHGDDYEVAVDASQNSGHEIKETPTDRRQTRDEDAGYSRIVVHF